MGNVSLDGAKFPALQRNILGRVTAPDTKDPLANIQLAIDEIVSVDVSAYLQFLLNILPISGALGV